jgi:hypothetical protein
MKTNSPKAGDKVIIPASVYELQPYEFQCAGCKKIHKRSLWSVAHEEVAHSFRCDCGHVTWLGGEDED